MDLWLIILVCGLAATLLVSGSLVLRRHYGGAGKGSYGFTTVLTTVLLVVVVGTSMGLLVKDRADSRNLEREYQAVMGSYANQHGEGFSLINMQRVERVYVAVSEVEGGSLLVEMLVGDFWVGLGELPASGE